MASPVLLGSVLRSQSRAEQAYSWGDHALEGYLLNVVEDTTPQLGGNLDVNGKSIVSASNGDITIDPHGTGTVQIKDFTRILGSGGAVSGGFNPSASDHQLFLENAGSYAQIAMSSDATWGTFISTKQGAGQQVYSGWWGGSSGYEDGNYVVTSNGDWVFVTGGSTTRIGRLDASGSVFLKERASAGTDVAAYGQLWIKDSTPNELWFTDDAGTDGRVVTNYERGTWTPTIWDTSNSDGEGQTYTIQSGYYTIIGNICYIWGDVQLSSKGTLTAGDSARIGGLPYAAVAGGISMPVVVGLGGTLNITAGQAVGGYVLNASTRIVLQLWDGTGGTSSLLVSELTNTSRLIFSAAYRISD